MLDREIQLPVKITNIVRKNKTLYRVRIGPIPTLETAEALAAALNIKELGEPTIVYQWCLRLILSTTARQDYWTIGRGVIIQSA